MQQAIKKGTTVRLINMDDPQAPPSGTLGTVIHVDDAGQIHVSWESGGSLALLPGIDRFEVVNTPST